MRFLRAPRLLKFLLVVMALLALARMGRTDDAADLAQALQAAQRGDWAGARASAGAPGSLGGDVIEWLRLRDANARAPFAAYRAFLDRRGDWPGIPWLRQIGEGSIRADEAPEAVASFFAKAAPQTGAGALAAVRAQLALGQRERAQQIAATGWRDLSFTAEEQAALLALLPEALKPAHTARADRLLWEGRSAEAQRMLPLLPAGWRRLAEARLGLRADVTGVDGLITAVPPELAGDPGLAWERYLWRKRKGRADDALALLLERSTSAEALGQPSRWARERSSLARELMRQGRGAEAYKVASRHFLAPADAGYADLEWLAGYLALRMLKRPGDALEHFTRFRMAVSTPISLSRAGYWEGRALEALGARADAQAAYEFGAEFQTAFYGLLAAEKAGLALDPALLGREAVPDWRQAEFLRWPVVQAGLLALRAGDLTLAARFLRHAAERLDARGLAQMAQMGLDLDAPHLGLKIAKYAAERGITLPRPYYPMHGLAQLGLSVAPELALSIARRESEFDPSVISGAGARGLMQLMPGTASDMAAELGIAYESARLLSDPAYNARLGAAYLEKMSARYGGNVMLISAAYNAGPSRPDRWLRELGDPRTGAIDVVDWIESLPFEETRNYVMRVTESVLVYRARLSGRTGPVTLTQELLRR